jgi:hypothetical protein
MDTSGTSDYHNHQGEPDDCEEANETVSEILSLLSSSDGQSISAVN